MERAELFWADKIAKQIIERKKLLYIDKNIPDFKSFVIKTSASISGVLHIGRLSDTIRGASVYKALEDAGKKTEIIWVAEDMDPLRKIPEGVPKNYIDYIGMSVTDIPDPFGCHESYGEHHVSEYFKVLDKFVSVEMKKFSMRNEYKKGSFKPYIELLLNNIEKLIEIQNKYRKTKLPQGWSPWTPICDNCNKIITPKILGYKDGKILYKCQDYNFEKNIAKGCGFEGENDPLKGNGKLMWKSEWASQWARWKVCTEGAGKEYQVPGSAFWINAEICEKILDFPSPIPIFYEHLMIDGKKMSASLGNVIYPKDWLEVAEPEILRFFYNKKLMKTRSFSWKDLPKLYDEYDYCEDVYYDKIKIQNERERQHIKRLYEISQIRQIPTKHILHIPYTFAAMVSQIIPEQQRLEKALQLFKATGHIAKKISERDKNRIALRLQLAKNWVELYAPEQKISLLEKPSAEILNKLTDKQKQALLALSKELEKKEFSEQELHTKIFDISRENAVEPKQLFSAVYQVLLGRPAGPRLAPFILAIGQEQVAEKIKSAIQEKA